MKKSEIEKKLYDLRYQRGYYTAKLGNPPAESWTGYLDGYEKGKKESDSYYREINYEEFKE